MDFILDLIFPKMCVVCESVGRFVCGNCVEKLQLAEKRRSVVVDELYSLFDYRQPEMKKIVRAIKYRFYTGLVKDLMELVEIPELGDVDLIVPVPLHRARENLRGFNQAELIAKFLSKKLKIDCKRVLVRVRHNKPLAELGGREEREKEIKGVFEVVKNIDLQGKTILLVDDVYTTGATMGEATSELKKKGVKRVIGFVLAS